jgi:hypothetical protein
MLFLRFAIVAASLAVTTAFASPNDPKPGWGINDHQL